MLGCHNFRKANEVRQCDCVEIPLPDADVGAMLRKLAIVQCDIEAAAASPPMSLPELVRVAMTINKYGMHNVLRAPSHM